MKKDAIRPGSKVTVMSGTYADETGVVSKIDDSGEEKAVILQLDSSKADVQVKLKRLILSSKIRLGKRQQPIERQKSPEPVKR